MTYLETLYYGIKHIAKRHNEIKRINTELTEHAEGDQKEPEVLIHVNIGLLNQMHQILRCVLILEVFVLNFI